MTLRKAATNLREVLESLSDDPASHEVIMAEGYGRALGLLESCYLYCPDARRLIESVLDTKLAVGSEFVGEMNSRTVVGHSVKV